MTTANKITIGRIVLIPVFVGFAIEYDRGFRDGEPMEWQRYAAVISFLVMSLSDALDGFIARRFGQQSYLGKVLDPVADKGLMMAALLVLGFSAWPENFPLWFAALIIGRDLVLVIGTFLLHHFAGQVHINAHLTGKIATFFQMVTILWTLLRLDSVLGLPFPAGRILVYIASLFTLISGILYFADGIRQLQQSESARESGPPTGQ